MAYRKKNLTETEVELSHLQKSITQAEARIAVLDAEAATILQMDVWPLLDNLRRAGVESLLERDLSHCADAVSKLLLKHDKEQAWCCQLEERIADLKGENAPEGNGQTTLPIPEGPPVEGDPFPPEEATEEGVTEDCLIEEGPTETPTEAPAEETATTAEGKTPLASIAIGLPVAAPNSRRKPRDASLVESNRLAALAAESA